MSEQALPRTEAASRPGAPPPLEAVVGVLLALEIMVFGVMGTNFLTRENALEVVRTSVEIGLLALALTPVIVTGGIDLSVGSLLGLSAVVFGKLLRDAGLPVELAALLTLALGAAAGGLNALFITRLGLPPLIVTLGTLSLFRGLAEGITAGYGNFSDFPERFLYLGNGYLFGVLPAQLPVLVAAAVGFWVLLQRTPLGRSLYAIGYSPDGARYAGVPVERRLALVYVLAGVVASLAGVVYAAHTSQAKADAGLNYELVAITAVVLGGTSIFGGRGTIHGTLLGLFALAVLQNGLRLADQPAELAGVLTGVLLLAAIILDRLLTRAGTLTHTHEAEGEFHVKNSQIAILSGVIIFAALIVAVSNILLLSRLLEHRNDTQLARNQSSSSAGGKMLTLAMMPKSKGNAYFRACQKGAEEAAQELGINLIWDGPTDPDPKGQNDVVEAWITRGVDVIAVAVENKEGIAPVLRKARDRGIKVITWDADTEPDARDFFVNQATNEAIGQTLMDHAARIMNNKGEFAIITASTTASNMRAWQEQIERRRQAKYPEIQMVDLRPCDDKQPLATEQAQTIMNSHPNLKLLMAICSPAVPGAAEAVDSSNHKNVKVIGLGLPNQNKRFVHEGTTECVVLWNTRDLGYLTVQAAVALKIGKLKVGDKEMQAGRLKTIQIAGDNILLGPPFTFTKENIDQFDF